MRRLKSLWTASPRKVLCRFRGPAGRGRGGRRLRRELQLHQRQPQQRVYRRHDLPLELESERGDPDCGQYRSGRHRHRHRGHQEHRSAAGTFTLAHTVAVDTPASPGLSKKLTLTVQDLGDPACVTVVPGRCHRLHGHDVRDAHDDRARRIARGCNPPLPVHDELPRRRLNGADNAYQGASTTVEYDWSSTS